MSYAAIPSVVESFNGTNGSTPLAGLLANTNGGLYGVTSAGGAKGDGAAFNVATSSPSSPFGQEFLDLTWLAQEFHSGLHGWVAVLAELLVAFNYNNLQNSQSNSGFVYTGARTSFGAASTAFSTALPTGSSAFPTLAANTQGH